MLKFVFLLAALFLYAPWSSADYNHIWAQAEAGFFGGKHIQIKAIDNKAGWSLGYSNYRDEITLISEVDRLTGEVIETNVEVIHVSRLWASPFSLGVVDFSIGVGHSKGISSDNCDDATPGFIGTSYRCDKINENKFGIPLQVGAIFGKYLGIGMSLDMFVREDRSFGEVSFSFPLGVFTR